MKLYGVLWFLISILQIINGKFIPNVTNASEPRNIHYLGKEVPIVKQEQNNKHFIIIQAPVLDCGEGMKRDKNGECRIIWKKN